MEFSGTIFSATIYTSGTVPSAVQLTKIPSSGLKPMEPHDGMRQTAGICCPILLNRQAAYVEIVASLSEE
jgi:hypothetical protein